MSQFSRQRQVNRLSAPLQNNPRNDNKAKQQLKLIFKDLNIQSELTEEALNMCRQLGINPGTLRLRAYEEFAEPGVSATVQEVRYRHYTDKRLCKGALIICW